MRTLLISLLLLTGCNEMTPMADNPPMENASQITKP